MTLDTQGNERYRLSLRDHERELAVCPDDCQPQVIFQRQPVAHLYPVGFENRGREIRAGNRVGSDSDPVPGSGYRLFMHLSETKMASTASWLATSIRSPSCI